MIETKHVLTKRFGNLYWEWKLGISTRGVYDIDYPDTNHYATMWYATIDRVLRHLALKPPDVFVDIGCGKGRVVCCAARIPVRKVIGIEISPDLCAIAQRNVKHMKGRFASVEILNVRAQEFDYREATALLLFNPFGPSTVEAVLERIRISARSHPFRIAYVNSVYDQIFSGNAWLQRVEHWDKQKMNLEHSVTFYASRQP